MDLSKQDKIKLALLTNIQTEILTLKEFFLQSIAGENDAKKKELDEIYNATRLFFQNSLHAQIKNGFQDGLGSIDDLLNNL